MPVKLWSAEPVATWAGWNPDWNPAYIGPCTPVAKKAKGCLEAFVVQRPAVHELLAGAGVGQRHSRARRMTGDDDALAIEQSGEGRVEGGDVDQVLGEEL